MTLNHWPFLLPWYSNWVGLGWVGLSSMKSMGQVIALLHSTYMYLNKLLASTNSIYISKQINCTQIHKDGRPTYQIPTWNWIQKQFQIDSGMLKERYCLEKTFPKATLAKRYVLIISIKFCYLLSLSMPFVSIKLLLSLPVLHHTIWVWCLSILDFSTFSSNSCLCSNEHAVDHHILSIWWVQISKLSFIGHIFFLERSLYLFH